MSWSEIGSSLCKVRKSDTLIVSDGSYRFSNENSLNLHWAPLPSRIYCTRMVRSRVLLTKIHTYTCTETHTPANTQHVKERVKGRGFLELNLSKKTSRSLLSFLLQMPQDEKLKLSRLGMDTECQRLSYDFCSKGRKTLLMLILEKVQFQQALWKLLLKTGFEFFSFSVIFQQYSLDLVGSSLPYYCFIISLVAQRGKHGIVECLY